MLRRCAMLAAAVAALAALTAAGRAGQSAPVFAHRAVAAANPQAQRLFDEGLTFLYAFNREAAQDRFQAAAAADPALAAAWWGYALALGPNINYGSDRTLLLRAVEAENKARALAVNALPADRALIEALAARYIVTESGTPEVRTESYERKMKAVAAAFADDPDVQALYMESVLDVDSAREGDGYPDMKAFAARSTQIARRWPEHLGLQHYIIHIDEENGAPAVAAARFLWRTPLVPEASHLTHMASHVFYYLGQWRRFSEASRAAIAMDVRQAATRGIEPAKLDYWRHNLDFWYGGAVLGDDEAGARAAATTAHEPVLAAICADRFGHTGEAARLLGAPGLAAALDKKNLRLMTGYAVVNADTGNGGQAERTATLIADGEQTPLRRLAVDFVRGRIAERAGRAAAARDLYQRAAELQDTLSFEAAPPWFYAPREYLAALELRAGDAAAASAAARADLRRHPHSMRTLAILRDAYQAAGRGAEAARTQREIDLVQTL